MAILIRYLIRSHLGPFFFAFTLLTGLLFLNTIAHRLDQLMGKGLPWTVLAEFAVLALPHTVALTLPMSVLVAVLYAFSDLTSENELTAMTGGGVNPVRILLPLVGIGVILAGAMFLFNDRVLPESNHRLKNLLVDIGRKSPTFQLREQVVNQMVASQGTRRDTYYVQALHIDPVTSELEDIVIYDVSDYRRHRTTYARRGTMAFNEDRTDLFLTLEDGSVYEVPADQLGGFQRVEFQRQALRIRGVGDVLEREGAGGFRSDREMSVGMMEREVRKLLEERDEVLLETRERGLKAVRNALGIRDEEEMVLESEDLWGEGVMVASAGPRSLRDLPPDALTREVALTARTSAARAESLHLSSLRLRVEIHKKYAIAFACIVFVLVGAPLAVRFPRGGAGMVITASVLIFALFWVFLIGGETLADRGHMNPALAMWMPNLLLLPLGIYSVRRMSRQVATARGGGWDDLLFTLADALARPFRRREGGEAA